MQSFFRCGICGARVRKSERTNHLMDWTIPKHAEWFVGDVKNVWRLPNGQIKAKSTKEYFIGYDYKMQPKYQWRTVTVSPHLSYGSSVSEYFDQIPEDELLLVIP